MDFVRDPVAEARPRMPGITVRMSYQDFSGVE